MREQSSQLPALRLFASLWRAQCAAFIRVTTSIILPTYVLSRVVIHRVAITVVVAPAAGAKVAPTRSTGNMS